MICESKACSMVRKTIVAFVVILLFCSSSFAAAKASGVKLPFDLNWKDTESTVRSKLTHQGFREMNKEGATREYRGVELGADAIVNVECQKNGISSLTIFYLSKELRGAGLPEEIQNVHLTLKADLGEPYKGSDPNIWGRVMPRRLVQDNVWYIPKWRHLVWVAHISSYHTILTYAYVERSLMYYYLIGGVISFAIAWGFRKKFSR